VRRTPIHEISVVVPAHDEEDRIGPCLESLRVAATHPSLARTAVRVVVVLDSCSDQTGERADRLGVDAIEVSARSVGPARSAGFAHLLGRAGVADRHHWLATTDADSKVPPEWLARQLSWHRRGAEAVAGTVEVQDWSEQPARVRHRFGRHQRAHGLDDGHGHVHGANLGLSADVYRRAGGVPHLPLAEDHALWDAVGATGALRISAPDLPVVTSSRRDGRAVGGFSDLLRSLSD
jgi:glycosyltransferase involved in cell wall biosynthesis